MKLKNFIIRDKKKQKLEFDKMSLEPKMYPIDLSQKEQDFLINNLKGINSYLEFGSGGSTFLTLLKTNVPKIISVESDPNWINYLREWDLIKKEENKRLYFKYINIGKTKKWGFPIEEKNNLFQNYSKEVFEKNCDYNLVLIDGRFRVACALQTILNCEYSTKILIDDFNDRPQYHLLLKFLDIIEPMDVMSLFKIKENIDIEEVKQLYEKYKFIPD